MTCDWFCEVVLALLSTDEVIFIPVGHDVVRRVADFCKDINEIAQGDLVEGVKGRSYCFIRGDIGR